MKKVLNIKDTFGFTSREIEELESHVYHIVETDRFYEQVQVCIFLKQGFRIVIDDERVFKIKAPCNDSLMKGRLTSSFTLKDLHKEAMIQMAYHKHDWRDFEANCETEALADFAELY
jgi:hypothetical protein